MRTEDADPCVSELIGGLGVLRTFTATPAVGKSFSYTSVRDRDGQVNFVGQQYLHQEQHHRERSHDAQQMTTALQMQEEAQCAATVGSRLERSVSRPVDERAEAPHAPTLGRAARHSAQWQAERKAPGALAFRHRLCAAGRVDS
jgi:hypothetical protein